MPFGLTHHAIVNLARWSLWAFYSEIKVVGEENVPHDGPIIFACNHQNMIVDPAVLATTIPHGRLLHFWAKNSLFKNKILRAILNDSGVVPVDRTSKNNQVLFKETFDALKFGECIAVFPEGTSYTGHKLLEMKDGASWAALEYEKNLHDNEAEGHASSKDVLVIPVGICYLAKSKYRSSIVVTYDKPLDAGHYKEGFFKDAKPEVKRMTRDIQKGIERGTINAPDWDIWNASHMSRILLFNHDKGVELTNYVEVTQTLIDTFNDLSSKDETIQTLIILLNQYNQGLKATGLSSLDIARYNPNRLSRYSTIKQLLKDTSGLLIRLPFFFPVLVFHWPIYIVGRWAAKQTAYEESYAQQKIMFNLLLIMVMYTGLFFAMWTVFLFNPLGALIAFGCTVIFAIYHVSQIDENYRQAKSLVRSWKLVLWVGLSKAAGKGPWADDRERVEALVKTRESCLSGLENLLKQHADHLGVKAIQMHIDLMATSKKGRWSR